MTYTGPESSDYAAFVSSRDSGDVARPLTRRAKQEHDVIIAGCVIGDRQLRQFLVGREELAVDSQLRLGYSVNDPISLASAVARIDTNAGRHPAWPLAL